MITGEVVSVNPRVDSFLMNSRDGRSIRVDAYRANGLQLTELESGDQVSVTGTFDTMGVLRASRIDRGTRGDYPRMERRMDRREMRREMRRERPRKDNDDDDDDEDEDEDED
jgi:hypothetical protein